MVDQPSLFDPPGNGGVVATPSTPAQHSYSAPTARFGDPDTSQGAAVIAIHRAATNRQMALEALRAAGERGLNDFELAEITGIVQTSVGVRRKSLERMGLVVPRMVLDVEKGRLVPDTRPSTTTGSPSRVYVAVEFQRADARAS